MLRVDADLPAGAVLDDAGLPLAAALERDGGLWLHGLEGSLTLSPDGAIAAWQPVVGDTPATPVEPNMGTGRPAAFGAHCGPRLRQGVPCGLVVPGALAGGSVVSVAVVYLPDPGADARTLWTLNGREADNYLFLSETDGALTVKDTAQRIALSVPAPAGEAASRPKMDIWTREMEPGAGSPQAAPRLLTVTLAGETLALQDGTGPVHRAQGLAPRLGAADLFIGARSHRKGLLKTLGSATVLDVMLWPGRALLAPRDAADAEALRLLHRYALWEY